MTNYLLSIDPSIKNTGFTLWENKRPVLIKSYDFKKYSTKYEVSKSDAIYNNNFNFLIKWEIEKLIKCDIGSLFYNNYFDLIIERGTFHSKNGIGYETQEHLRGFIAGQFNKLITKDMLISPTKWKSWWINGINEETIKFDWIGIGPRAWDKELSLEIANWLIKENNWNVKISNHDEADSLLIGWYYLNKENK